METLSIALPALSEAIGLISQPIVLGYLVLGVVMGLSIGVFPGLGGIAGLSLLLPFMFGMDPVLGLALMIGMVAVVPTSDTFASVLMGIPGSSASQATVLDGFPMAKKGEAARALSAAFASSLFGGLVGATFLTVFILIARPLVLAFGLPEMLMVTILGLSMVAILAGRVVWKGLAAAGLGLMVGTIGEADAGGSLRMATYDLPYLTDGLKLVIVGLGIFAVPEIVSLLRQDSSISKSATLGSGWMEGVRDWFRNIWLSMRCSIIGVMVGVIPGLGGSVVDWISYGHAVQTTKDKSQFGKGEIRGIVGPESSNNAKEGGGLVPTLLFVIGLIGIFLRRFDWSRPAFLIGFVLSNPAETFTNQAYQIAASRFRKSFEEGIDYIFSPIVIVLLIVTALSVFFGLRQAKMLQAEGDVKSGSKRAPVTFLLVVTAYLAVAVINASFIPNYAFTDKVFPLFAGSVALVCCLILVFQMMMKPEADVIFADKEAQGEDADAPHGLWSTLAWFAGLLALSALFGFIIALALFPVSFFRVRAQVSWTKAVLLAACGIGFMLVMAGALNRDFPPGLLQSLVDLLWPLT
ncbi:tripartite tricarboxylate transporter permease [Dinoroseobacter sp. S375]|uniref:tripartite tricarboxylate transporter permease n=1 Tax=Dinoroseobacter sp. S375 TaxID=3415136 RepID=UPI003C7AD772